MFRAIWEFAQSRDCVAHSRNPENAQAISGLSNTCAQSRDCATIVCILGIPRMRNTILRLRKFSDCTEHIYVYVCALLQTIVSGCYEDNSQQMDT